MIEALIKDELNAIVDPCSVVAGAPAGIVELGLVRKLTITPRGEGYSVLVRIGVTEPGCLMGASFAVKARERLGAMPGIVSVDVQLDHAAEWEPTDIDPAYGERLARVRAAREEGLAR